MNIHKSYSRLLYPILFGLALTGYASLSSAVDVVDTANKENSEDTENLKKSHGRNI